MPSDDLRGERAARQRDDVGPHHEERHRHAERDHARQDQPQAVRDAHHAHRVEFLGHAHHADLRGDRRARAARHQNRRQHRPQFANHRQPENIDDVLVRAKQPQLLRRQIAQHDADQERDQRGDRQGLGAGVIDVRGDLGPRRDLRFARDREKIEHDAPEHADAAVQVLEEREDREAQPGERIELDHRLDFFARRVEQRDALENVALRIGERGVRGHLVAPHAPQRLTADVIHPVDTRQVPLADARSASQRVQQRDHVASGLVACERERRPLARKPDDLALAAGRDFKAGRSVVVQGSLESGYRIRGHCNEGAALEPCSRTPGVRSGYNMRHERLQDPTPSRCGLRLAHRP